MRRSSRRCSPAVLPRGSPASGALSYFPDRPLTLRVTHPVDYFEHRFAAVVFVMNQLKSKTWSLGTETYRVYGPHGLEFAYEASHAGGGGGGVNCCADPELTSALYGIDLSFGEIEGEGGLVPCGYAPAEQAGEFSAAKTVSGARESWTAPTRPFEVVKRSAPSR